MRNSPSRSSFALSCLLPVARLARLPHMNTVTEQFLTLGKRGVSLRLFGISLAFSAAYPHAAEVTTSAPDRISRLAFASLADASYGVMKLAEIQVETDRNGAPADGQSVVHVSVKLLDQQGQVLQDNLLLTLEVSAGRILLDEAATDVLGPQGNDADRVTPGVQLNVKSGIAHFRLLAPTDPQEVLLRVSGAGVSAQGVLSFLPELRNMLAVGLVEGIISKRSLSAGALAPARFNDGFEQDLTRWSRQFDDGKTIGARAALFLKGTIAGDILLTAAFDSDQQTRSHLQRDINPNEFYPVYGDSAMTGFDARSSERLYVRVDDKKSYLLYGDFSTGEGFSSSVPGPFQGLQARKLGQYQRTVTGLRAHWDLASADMNGFAIYDNVKQVIEEYQANGTSGPFAVRSNSALTNSERVELLVRDKNQSDRIKQITPLRRMDDYSFEPFSGRILFKQAVPALSADGDPQSIRITYEVEQGGDKFWVMGADGNWQLNPMFSFGAGIVEDTNPQSPFRLQSVNANLKLGSSLRLTTELAHTDSTTYSVNGQAFSTPSGLAGEISSQAGGNAARVELAHRDEQNEASLQWQKADGQFNNVASGVSPGHSDISAKAAHKIDDSTTVYVSGLRSKDQLVAASRDAMRIGAQWRVSDSLKLDVSLQRMKEQGELKNGGVIAGNSTPLGSDNNLSGGFFGFGNTNSALNPISGTSMSSFSASQNAAQVSSANELDATTIALGANYALNARTSLSGVVEHGISDTNQKRFELGAQYQLAERSRAYARYENQTGLASRYSLNPAEKSNAFVAGVETSYLPGASLFTEYRLRDALATDLANSRDLQLASGMRNTWNLDQGLAASTNAEYLHVFDGKRQKGIALAGGLDYTANPLWKSSAKLEWRRLYDSQVEPGNQRQDQWLSTLSVARKLDRDWTALGRNYLLLTRNNDNASGASIGNSLQERAQLGLAWRPVDHNLINSLMRYEYKNVRDDAQISGESYIAHIVSTHLDYHPSRPWWMSARVAAKSSLERRLPKDQQTYQAWMLSGRVVYDITERWDFGVLGSYLHSPQGGSSQYARGLEAGYLLKENLWLSVGYNLSGFQERDLNAADYTAKGAYLRLRFKFDENLFKGDDPVINRALAR